MLSVILKCGKASLWNSTVWDDTNLLNLCRSQFVGAVEGAVGDGGWGSDEETSRKCSSSRLTAKEKQSTVSFTFSEPGMSAQLY